MPSTPHSQTALFDRLLEGKLSPGDTEILIAWLGSDELEPEAAKLILAQLRHTPAAEQVSPDLLAMLERKLPAILGQQEQPDRLRFLKAGWLRYAAAFIIILFGVAIYFRVFNKPSQQMTGARPVPSKTNIEPGKEGAVLTLADGSIIVLDSLGNGLITTQNGSKVLLDNGQLAYNTNGTAGSDMAFNTMTTPKGRQFRVLLSDGTKVWLNAASSLHYPAVFTGKGRMVAVTGEAYFEVAKNTDPSTGLPVPFHVKVNDKTQVEVLGTHFNINSYKDEASINTTLLEGSVRILNGYEKALLQPGQQAQVGHYDASATRIKILNDANVEKVMAWKNGLFNFQDASLEEVMRQLERWYDIEVVYEKDIPKLEFIGKMGRDLSLADVLRGLEMSKVHFRIEDRRVVVLP